MKRIDFRGIRPDDLHGRMALRNPERGFRTEIYVSTIPDEIAGLCSCHAKQLKLDGRPEMPIYQNETVPGVPRLIRGNRLTGLEFSHGQWMDELDYFAYDGVTVAQSYVFLMKYQDGRDLPPEKLADIECFFRKLRESGAKALLRFAYELSPAFDGPTGATILKHLSQLAPLIRANSDVIYVLQSGFIGKFGEWHNSFHHLQDDFAFHNDLFETVLEVLPPERRTMVRYPVIKQRLYGDAPLTESEAFANTPRARIGHFNDGFLANETHGGTFGRDDSPHSPEHDFAYLAAEGKFLPMDGELFWRDAAGHPALPTEAVRLLHKWHYDTLSFVHGNCAFEGKDGYSIDIWKRVPVDPLFLKDSGLPVPDGYFTDAEGRFVWRSYYEYIRDLLGYRIELQSLEYEISDGRMTGEITLANKGFSAPANPRPAFLKVGDEAHLLATDIRRWYSGETQVLSFDVPVPAAPCEIGLWMPDAAPSLSADPRYALRCANAIPFSDGVNVLTRALSRPASILGKQ